MAIQLFRGIIFSWFLCCVIFVQAFAKLLFNCTSTIRVVLSSRLTFLTSSGINSRSRLWNQTGFEHSLEVSVHITIDCLCRIGVQICIFKVKGRDKITLALRSAGGCSGLLVNLGYRIRSTIGCN